MQLFRFAVVILSIGALGTGLALAQLPLEPVKKSGQSISAAYEGWYKNGDGTYTLLVGYFNRNKEESIEIPVGPDNRFEPGEADRGQPTHFQPKRNWGVFTIVMPADFAGKEITWHLTANNKSTKVPMRLNPLWEVEPYRDAAVGNTPPTVRLEADGKEFTGPPSGIAATYEATVSEPLTRSAGPKSVTTASRRYAAHHVAPDGEQQIDQSAHAPESTLGSRAVSRRSGRQHPADGAPGSGRQGIHGTTVRHRRDLRGDGLRATHADKLGQR